MFVPWWDNCWPSFTLALQARLMLCPRYQLSIELLYIYLSFRPDWRWFFSSALKGAFCIYPPHEPEVLLSPELSTPNGVYIYICLTSQVDFQPKVYVQWVFAWEEHARAMLGPCLGHVYPISTLRLTRVLKCSWLSQISFRDKSTKCFENGTIQWSYMDHVGAMFN